MILQLQRLSCEQTLQLAFRHQIQSIAVPTLGFRVYQYSIKATIEIVHDVARKHGENHQTQIVFCCFSETVYEAYQKLLVEQ